MKKISSIIAIVLCLVLSMPIISDAENQVYMLKSSSSVDGVFSGNQNTWCKNVCGTPSESIIDIYNALSSLPSGASDYPYYMILFNKSNINDQGTISYVGVNSDSSPYVISTYTSNSLLSGSDFWVSKVFGFCVYDSADSPTGAVYNYTIASPSQGWVPSSLDKYAGFSNRNDHYFTQDAYRNGVVLDCNVPVLINLDIGSLSNTNLQSDDYKTIYANSDSFTNYCSSDMPYIDSSGSIITPGVSENILDKSIAFRKVDLSTIYSYTAKAHCAGLLAWELDPVGYSIIDDNLAGWTMHYNILVTYKWDTSMDNVVFRPFYNGGSASGTVTWDIDIEPTGSIKANEQKFDIYDLLNTYQVSQGSSADIANLGLAVYALKNGKGSVLGDFFGQLGQDITDISTQIGQANLFSINGYSANDISQIFTPTYTYALTHLDMQVVAYPVNNTAHIKGKPGTTKLNLVTNTNSSYAQGAEVTDSESGYDIVSPDYESSGDTVVTPVNNGSGSQVYVVINNPLSTNTGGGSSSSSSSSPSINIDNGGTISFDPGYRDLRNDVISSENDWGQYFLPFKDSNGVGEMFGSFLDNMPDELKVIFIGGFGVLTCFAIYRFIRRG